MTPIVIIGAGGFGREVHDIVLTLAASANDGEQSAPDFVGFLDDGPADLDLVTERGPLLGGVATLADLPTDVRYVIGIGSASVKRTIDRFATAAGRSAATLVHPAAWVGPFRNRFAPGVIICANVAVTTNITLGRHTHLHVNCTVGHDSTLDDYVSVFPGATVSGNVRLHEAVTIGTGAAVIQGRSVGADSIIGAGASVVRDIPAGVTAVGVPARPR